MDLGLTDKIVWVTGATGAIGREIATVFSNEGARVVLSARTETELKVLKEDLEKNGKTAVTFPVDVTKPKAVNSAARKIVEKFGRIDILATTVAVPAFGPFSEIDSNVFRSALEIKYLGYINCFQAALPHMLKNETGVIMAITGTGGKQPISIHLPGGSVNAALNLVLKGLANEYGKEGIRVNAVSPGPIMSERQQQMIDAGMGDPAKGIPLRRLGNAREVADAVVFLASSRAAYITGQILSIDGGGIKAL
tara:strand:+ start:347 stop:1099 length:753 start_codon:yes stop_codon:yes gene_type:complete